MDRLGYTAMTAASRTMMSLTVRSNNLANVNTPGFRADLERAQAVAVEGYGYDSRHMAVVENNGVSLAAGPLMADRKSTRLNSSHVKISYAVFCLKKKKQYQRI